MTSPTPDPRPRPAPPARARRPASGGHPAGKAALLMVGLVVLIVLLSAAPLVFN